MTTTTSPQDLARMQAQWRRQSEAVVKGWQTRRRRKLSPLEQDMLAVLERVADGMQVVTHADQATLNEVRRVIRKALS